VKQSDIQQQLLYYPTQTDLQRRTEDFIKVNGLDSECTSTVQQLSPDLLAKAMGDDFLITAGNGTGSDVVMERIRKARGGSGYDGAPEGKRTRYG
jgi:hypothetical protein